MRNNVLVMGANGQLGKALSDIVVDDNGTSFQFISRQELDLSDVDAIEAFFENKSIDVVVNCAAYTAVDKAELELDLANAINHLAVKKVADVCKRKEISLIHISTDYVFNGESFKPYTEIDAPDPKNVYGETKLNGELAIKKINPNGIIIRTSWVYYKAGNNFVKTMLRLGNERNELNVVSDQIGTPTYAGDLAETIISIINHADFKSRKIESSLYHFSNEGVASWYDFAKAIFELRNIDCEINPIDTSGYPTPAKRPQYSVMSKTKIKKDFGVNVPYWRDSLKKMLGSEK